MLKVLFRLGNLDAARKSIHCVKKRIKCQMGYSGIRKGRTECNIRTAGKRRAVLHGLQRLVLINRELSSTTKL